MKPEDDYIQLEDILEEKVEVPAGLKLVKENDKVVGIVYDQKAIIDSDAMEALVEFTSKVVGDIPKYNEFGGEIPEGMQVGNYLVATDVVGHDAIFGKSIIKMTKYNPLATHVAGIGVIDGHPSDGWEAGWSLDQLCEEHYHGVWDLKDKKGMEEYAKDNGLKLIEDY